MARGLGDELTLARDLAGRRLPGGVVQLQNLVRRAWIRGRGLEEDLALASSSKQRKQVHNDAGDSKEVAPVGGSRDLAGGAAWSRSVAGMDFQRRDLGSMEGSGRCC